jgi:hypothetical protein
MRGSLYPAILSTARLSGNGGSPRQQTGWKTKENRPAKVARRESVWGNPGRRDFRSINFSPAATFHLAPQIARTPCRSASGSENDDGAGSKNGPSPEDRLGPSRGYQCRHGRHNFHKPPRLDSFPGFVPSPISICVSLILSLDWREPVGFPRPGLAR